MRIENSNETDVLKISIQSKNPEEAALLVNTIIDVYKQSDLNWATGEMQHLKQFLKEQLSIKEIELNNIENELKDFQENQKVSKPVQKKRMLQQDKILPEKVRLLG